MQLSVTYKDKLIPCKVILRKRKSITIKVDASGQVTVLAPVGTSKKVILEQVQGKAQWIVKQLDYFNNLRLQTQALTEKKGILYLGREYPLQLEIDPGRTNFEVKLEVDKIIVRTPVSDRSIIKEVLEAWYRKQAREQITERIACYEDRIARVPGRVCIKTQKCRWGSCSTLGNLNFNWRLVMAPARVIDYVVVHELCHLLELNHSRKFWDLVAQFIPEYKESKEWLKKNAVRMNW